MKFLGLPDRHTIILITHLCCTGIPLQPRRYNILVPIPNFPTPSRTAPFGLAKHKVNYRETTMLMPKGRQSPKAQSDFM